MMFFDHAGRRSRLTRRYQSKLACLVLLLTSVVAYLQEPEHSAHSDLEFASSDSRLVDSFHWAKREALSYVSDNDPVGPWYEAALPGRHAFCMRDTAHQADGAQALGLARYNHNMLRRFAENISATRDWCSYWEIDRLNRPAPVDYKSDAEFWYNLPANFDVLDACYRMYLWTGDRSYIDDPIFLNFYDRTIHEYTAHWNLSPDRVMKRTSDIQTPPFFRGDPTYEESSTDNLVGVDLLATQYAANRDYAAIEAARGNGAKAESSLKTAAQIKSLINTTWWNPAQGYFYAFLNKEHQFTGRAGADLLYRDAADDGPKTASALHTLLTTNNTEPTTAVEAKSHYAEILYRYGDPDAAYAEIMDLTRAGRERREYPEVSYSVIGAMVTGLMGIRVEPTLPPSETVSGKEFDTVIETLPQLTAKTSWAEMRDLPVQDHVISVRHEGNRSTILTNTGNSPLQWRAAFPGSYEVLVSDGKPLKAHTGSHHIGHAITWAELTVPGGSTIEVKVSE
jgi:hypothetical protein